MECKACGYKVLREEQTFEYPKEFIKINGNFTMEREMNYGTGIEPVKLYACPECYTVIMERW